MSKIRCKDMKKTLLHKFFCGKNQKNCTYVLKMLYLCAVFEKIHYYI